MTNGKPNPEDLIEHGRHTTEAAVSLLENLPLGDASAPAEAMALASAAEIAGHARAKVFPAAIARVDPVALQVADRYLDFANRAAEAVADVHQRSVESFPELAALVRTDIIMARVRADLERRALASGYRADHESVNSGLATLEATLAGQLRGRPEFEPAASVLADDVPAWRRRIQASRERREQFARAEVERLTADREAAAIAVQRAEIDRRNDHQAFFAARASRVFNLPNGVVAEGQAVAALVRGSMAYDVQGQCIAATLSLAAADQLRLETEAAEAVR